MCCLWQISLWQNNQNRNWHWLVTVWWRNWTQNLKTLKFHLVLFFVSSIRKWDSCRLEVEAQTHLQRNQVRLVLFTCPVLSPWSMFLVNSLPFAGSVPNFKPPAGSIYTWACSQAYQLHQAFFFSPDVLSIHPSFDPVFHPSIQPFLPQEACTCCSSKWLGHHL